MFRNALIVGKFAPFHRGHQHLIDTALAESAGLTVLVYSRPDFVAMPAGMRAGWVREIYPTVDVRVPEYPPLDDGGDDLQRSFVRDYLARRRIEVDAVFTSEDYGEGFAAFLGVPHRLVDRTRLAVPVSGTKVRGDLAGHLRDLHPIVFAALRDAGDLEARADSG